MISFQRKKKSYNFTSISENRFNCTPEVFASDCKLLGSLSAIRMTLLRDFNCPASFSNRSTLFSVSHITVHSSAENQIKIGKYFI